MTCPHGNHVDPASHRYCLLCDSVGVPSGLALVHAGEEVRTPRDFDLGEGRHYRPFKLVPLNEDDLIDWNALP